MTRASTDEVMDDTVLGMFRRHNADHFVKAAKLAHERGQGYCYLLDRGLYVRYRKAFGFEKHALTNAERAVAFCFMAAMIEDGDA